MLQEGDMPIEQLLAMYGYGGAPSADVNSSSSSMSPDSSQGQDTRSSSEEEILSNQDLTLDKDEIARDLLSNSDENEDKETDVHDLLNSVSSSQTARLLRCKCIYNIFLTSTDKLSVQANVTGCEKSWMGQQNLKLEIQV